MGRLIVTDERTDVHPPQDRISAPVGLAAWYSWKSDGHVITIRSSKTLVCQPHTMGAFRLIAALPKAPQQSDGRSSSLCSSPVIRLCTDPDRMLSWK